MDLRAIYFCPPANIFPALYLLFVNLVCNVEPPQRTWHLLFHAFIRAIWCDAGLVITTSHFLVIIYQAQSYKHAVENNGRAWPQPTSILLFQRHWLSEIVMSETRDISHLKPCIWANMPPSTLEYNGELFLQLPLCSYRVVITCHLGSARAVSRHKWQIQSSLYLFFNPAFYFLQWGDGELQKSKVQHHAILWSSFLGGFSRRLWFITTVHLCSSFSSVVENRNSAQKPEAGENDSLPIVIW